MPPCDRRTDAPSRPPGKDGGGGAAIALPSSAGRRGNPVDVQLVVRQEGGSSHHPGSRPDGQRRPSLHRSPAAQTSRTVDEGKTAGWSRKSIPGEDKRGGSVIRPSACSFPARRPIGAPRPYCGSTRHHPSRKTLALLVMPHPVASHPFGRSFFRAVDAGDARRPAARFTRCTAMATTVAPPRDLWRPADEAERQGIRLLRRPLRCTPPALLTRAQRVPLDSCRPHVYPAGPAPGPIDSGRRRNMRNAR